MRRYKHCNLCKHVERKISSGIFCRITGERPNFDDTCPSFKLDYDNLQEINQLKSELEKVELKTKKFRSKFYFLLMAGVITTVIGYYFFEKNTKSIVSIKFALFICSFGIIFISVALERKLSFTRKRNKIYNRIVDFKEILNKYK